MAALLVTVSAIASPPPPPPEYVYKAGLVLAASGNQYPAMVASLFAKNVMAFDNGKSIAIGKVAWLTWRTADAKRHPNRVLGYSESSGGFRKGSGELMVLDTFDTVDRIARASANELIDPWMATRSTLYQFGPDHLVHSVHMQETGGFWINSKP